MNRFTCTSKTYYCEICLDSAPLVKHAGVDGGALWALCVGAKQVICCCAGVSASQIKLTEVRHIVTDNICTAGKALIFDLKRLKSITLLNVI